MGRGARARATPPRGARAPAHTPPPLFLHSAAASDDALWRALLARAFPSAAPPKPPGAPPAGGRHSCCDTRHSYRDIYRCVGGGGEGWREGGRGRGRAHRARALAVP